MNEQIAIPEEVVMSKIYVIRGEKVMLDRDLAELYDVKAIRLREQPACRTGRVKRNSEKFPRHFMFQLTNEEVETMVSQFAIPSKQHLGGALPYVFTEHGLLQLANVLKSGRATQMSIRIIDVFVRMREMLLTQKDLFLEVEEIRKKVSGQDENTELIFNYLKRFIQEKESPREKVGYKLPNEN